MTNILVFHYQPVRYIPVKNTNKVRATENENRTKKKKTKLRNIFLFLEFEFFLKETSNIHNVLNHVQLDALHLHFMGLFNFLVNNNYNFVLHLKRFMIMILLNFLL